MTRYEKQNLVYIYEDSAQTECLCSARIQKRYIAPEGQPMIRVEVVTPYDYGYEENEICNFFAWRIGPPPNGG